MKVKYIGGEVLETEEVLEGEEATPESEATLVNGKIYECLCAERFGLDLQVIDETGEANPYSAADFEIVEKGNTFKVAAMQVYPGYSLFENLQKGMGFCRKAKEMGADLALFPEMWSTGYTIPQDVDKLKATAIERDSAFLRSFATLAKELDMAIGVTYLEAASPRPKNSLCVFDRFGNRVLDYAKVHTCVFGDEAVLSAGDDFYVADLNTASGNVKIGGMICYDREFPESARILMLKGAEIILVPNACPMEINRLSQLRARAFENMTGIVTCNYPAGRPDCNGLSSAFDGVAYVPGMKGSRDTGVLMAGHEEGIYIAEFDMDMLRAYRETEVHGNCYRQPEKYKLLLDKKVEAPFKRSDRK